MTLQKIYQSSINWFQTAFSQQNLIFGYWEIINFGIGLWFKTKWYLNLIPDASDLYLSGRTITFEDDFTGNTLDTTKWNFAGSCWENYFPSDSAILSASSYTIQDSILQCYIINNPGYWSGWEGTGNYQYNIFNVQTNPAPTYGIKGFTQKHGRFECKAKVCNKLGTWPAFWLLSQRLNISGMTGILPEVDIFESGLGPYGNKNLNIQFTIHAGKQYDSELINNGTIISNLNLNEDFFIYAVEITDHYVKWYINNQLVKIYNTHILIPDFRPDFPQYIILGDGIVLDLFNAQNYTFPFKSIAFDWVRVYQ